MKVKFWLSVVSIPIIVIIEALLVNGWFISYFQGEKFFSVKTFEWVLVYFILYIFSLGMMVLIAKFDIGFLALVFPSAFICIIVLEKMGLNYCKGECYIVMIIHFIFFFVLAYIQLYCLVNTFEARNKKEEESSNKQN